MAVVSVSGRVTLRTYLVRSMARVKQGFRAACCTPA